MNIDLQPSKCNHEPIIENWLAYMHDAWMRMERGEHQYRCKCCMKFVWESQFYKTQNTKTTQ